MSPTNDHELYHRIAKLENDITEIKEILAQLAPNQLNAAVIVKPSEHELPPTRSEKLSQATPPEPPSALARPAPTSPPPTPKAPSGFTLPKHMRKIEYWLSRIGIGLVLFGVVFAFKYSIDQGWITPPVRHLFGLGLGLLLFIFGLRFYGKRQHFAQVLLGGSIGTFYITVFSAFQLFGLVSHPIAFGLMVTITLVSFFIALRQNNVIFSLIGVMGGLGTPFMLYTGSGNIPGLIGYTCLVLVGSTAVYFLKGWRLLLWASVMGGWIVIALGMESSLYRSTGPAVSDQWALEIGVLFAWLCFWFIPVLRRIAQASQPERWIKSSLGIGDASLSESGRNFFGHYIYLLAAGSPLVALSASTEIWPALPDYVFGWTCVGAALLYGLVARFLRRHDNLADLAFAHIAVGTMLLTIAFWYLLEGESLRIVLAAEAIALHTIARRLKDQRVALGGHLVFFIVGLWVFLRLVNLDGMVSPVFGSHVIIDLVVVLAGIATAFIVSKPIGLRIYLTLGVMALALFFNRELSGDLLYLVLILEATAVYIVARWLKDEFIETISHSGYALMGLWLVTRLLAEPQTGVLFFNYQAGADIVLIACGLGVARWAASVRERQVYLFSVHLAVLALLARELTPLDNGQGFVTIAWGIYGALLLIVGLRMNLARLRLVALGTMILVVIKLFIVDLAELETIWRVLLFVGFGGVFLLLSYYFPRLWRTDSEP